MNVFHIVSEMKIQSPVKALCGAELDRMNGDYVWADQVSVDKEYRSGKHCTACIDSDDYALYLLGNAGEVGESNGWDGTGTVTGRMSSSKANISNVPRISKAMLIDSARKMNKPNFNAQNIIISASDYAAIEREYIKK
jgi:hypothetical protein